MTGVSMTARYALAAVLACAGGRAFADPLAVARASQPAATRPTTLPEADAEAGAVTPESAGYLAKKRDYFPFSAARRKAEPAKAGANDKIVGGAKAAQGAYPFQVALLRIKRTGPGKAQLIGQFCAGTLITSRYVLTAAHCFVEGRKGKVEGVAKSETVGVHIGDVNIVNGGDKILVKRIIVHPKYVTGANVNDIALVELERPPRDDVGAATVTVVDRPSEAELIPVDGDLRIIGWGKTESGKSTLDLNEATVKAVDRGRCNRALTAARMRDGEVQKALSDLSFEFNLGAGGRRAIEANIAQQGGSVTPQMFCAAAPVDGADTCGGDSGGPILRREASGRWVQVGVVSFGVGQCGKAELPGVYTRLALYTDWLRSVVDGPSPAPSPAPKKTP